MKRKADAPALRAVDRRSPTRNGAARLADADRELTIDELIIDDEEPVENFFIEKQRRLLTDSLYAGWRGPGRGRTFIAASDVGVFPEKKQTPIVPDVLLSLDVPAGLDPARKEHRSYFIWIMGKPPDVVFEFVSDRRGGEEGHKKARYAQIGVRYYVIFDPQRWLRGDVLRSYELRRDGAYHALKDHHFQAVGLGVKLWQGKYEGWDKEWLRWHDRRGRLIATGAELAEAATRRANRATRHADSVEHQAKEERRRREKLEAQLRALGQEPTA
jgi:Uma2 family endonuclease